MDDLNLRLRQIEANLRYLRNDSPLSADEKKERIEKLLEERNEVINLINFFSETNKKIDILKSKDTLTKEEKKDIKSLESSLNAKRKDYNKRYQGKYRDLLSAYFGQVDKRIHNFVYKNNSLWRSKNNRVSKRYSNTFGYFIKNAGISALIYVGSGLVLGPLLPAAFPYALGVAGVYLGQTVVKTVATIYNKIKYGGPRLQRKYDISKDGYLTHVGDCWNKIVHGNTLSLSEVRKIHKTKSESKESSEKLRTPSEEDLNTKDDKTKSFIDTINKNLEDIVDVNILSKERMKMFVKIVNDNNLIDKLSDKAKEKYQQIIERLNKMKEKEENDSSKIFLNSMNKKLESIINVSSLTKEQMENIVQDVKANDLIGKLSEKALSKYNQIVSSLESIDNEEKRKKMIGYVNNYLSHFDFKNYKLEGLKQLIIYINDNKLYNDLTDDSKKVLNRIKLLRDVMIEIDKFDMNNFDEAKAREIVNFVNNNKLASQMLTEYVNKCNVIQKRLIELKPKVKNDEETNNKRKKNNTKEDQKYKEKLKLLSDMLKNADLSKLSLIEISTYISYIKNNGLEKDFPDLVKQLNKLYNVKVKNEPKMSDYGNKRIGIIGENQEFFARLFINHPTIIKKGESADADEVRVLAKKIKDGVATLADTNRYAMLIYKMTGEPWFQDVIEEYLDSEYDKYLADKKEYEGKRAK